MAAMSLLHLKEVNSNVVGVHTADGSHVGNLKRVGAIWKFKAVGYGNDGAVEPGYGPLTAQHNAVFVSPDVDTVNQVLGPHCDPHSTRT